MKKRHRIFIAINLPGDIKKELSLYQKKWHNLPAKWMSEDNLHITLVFLGDLTDIELGEVCVVIKEVAKNHNSFDINLNKIRYGPDGKVPPRMIWASGDKSKQLSSLKKDLENRLSESIRFKPEVRTFSPHITLAMINAFEWRAIEPEERPEVNENIDLSFSVESIDVMESVLKRTGPKYSIIESHDLRTE